MLGKNRILLKVLLIFGLCFPQSVIALENKDVNVEENNIYMDIVETFEDELVEIGVFGYGQDESISGLYFSMQEDDNDQENQDKLFELLKKYGIDCEVRIETFPVMKKENFLEIRFKIDEKKLHYIFLNEKNIPLKNKHPYIDSNGRIQIPIRILEDLFSCSVMWNESENSIHIGDFNWSIYPEKGYIKKLDGEIIESDFHNMDGTMYMPVRTLARCLGGEVTWNPRYQYAMIRWETDL